MRARTGEKGGEGKGRGPWWRRGGLGRREKDVLASVNVNGTKEERSRKRTGHLPLRHDQLLRKPLQAVLPTRVVLQQVEDAVAGDTRKDHVTERGGDDLQNCKGRKTEVSSEKVVFRRFLDEYRSHVHAVRLRG